MMLLSSVLLLIHMDWLWRWDRMIYDWHLRWWSRLPAENILIVAVDEESLNKLGQWPWSRRLHAKLINQLTAAGAKVIALDILFSEPNSNDTQGDDLLAAAIDKSGRVVLPVAVEQVRPGGQLVEILPLPTLTAAAAGLGHVDAELDQDGLARGLFLKAGLGSPYWPTLALAMLKLIDSDAEQALPRQQSSANSPSSSSPYVWVRDHPILIPFAGPPGHFPAVSYVDALGERLPATVFRNKLILVGATAQGLTDALATPVSGRKKPMPGVEFNANVLDTLQRNLAIQPLSTGWHMLLTGGLVLLPVWLHPRLSPWHVLVVMILLLVAVIGGSVVLSRTLQLWFPPAPALLGLVLSYPLWSWRRLQRLGRLLFAEKQRAEITLHAIGDGVIVTDVYGVVEYMNPKAENLTGWSLVQARGQGLSQILCFKEAHGDVGNPITLCLQQNHAVELDEKILLAKEHKRELTVRLSAAPIRNDQGDHLGAVLAITDLTETHQLNQQLVYRTNYDPLTELPNRHLLQDRLTQTVARARRSNQLIAVLLVDIDRFKTVNDSLGQKAGDRLLATIAARLKAILRQEDTVARPGSDEFIIVLENTREPQVAMVAKKVLHAMETPFHIDNHEFFVSCSIGVSVFPKDGEEPETLLKNADTAMYRAKEKGRNTIQFYAQGMNQQALNRLVMEHNLRRALTRQELELYYQPQVELNAGRICGVEALLRWRHPQLGLVSPMDFIPLAEETGLIVPIGEWALKTACAQTKRWHDQGIKAIRIAVNLSPRQFMQVNLVDMVRETLLQTGLKACYLDLEITESMVMKNVEEVIPVLHALKALGVQLSVDDFGTGYSSLSYLKRFPIDQLKIDKAFVRDINTDSEDSAIALAVIAMAHSMKLKVLAEGVETKTQLAFLRSNRCDEMQGYYMSCPLPTEEATTLLRSHGQLAFD